MNTILVPIDGSGRALKAVHIASDLAEKYDGRIKLLYVLQKGKKVEMLLGLSIAGKLDQKLKARLLAEAKRPEGITSLALLRALGLEILEQAARRVRRRGVGVDILPMEEGDPVELILAAQKTTGANTIVMGSRGVSQAQEAAFGSVSHAIFERADCTCLSVK